MLEMTVYVVEQYHYDRDFWSPVGKFSKIEVANAVKEMLECNDRNTSCTVYESHIFDSVEEYLAENAAIRGVL